MKVGIIGVGNIGTSLAQRLSSTGHDVKVANSRGPETIAKEVLAFGARAVTVPEAVSDVDVVILSVPLSALPALAPALTCARSDTVFIDTSNYYPARDGRIAAIEQGQVESNWVCDQLGRPVVKAWNAIGADALARKGKPAGSAGRIAIPVAGDDERDRKVAMALVDDTGLDAVDAGVLADSWRQQPGTPVYCTELSLAQLPDALAAADARRAPLRREIALAAIIERYGDGTTTVDADFGVRLSRALYM